MKFLIPSTPLEFRGNAGKTRGKGKKKRRGRIVPPSNRLLPPHPAYYDERGEKGEGKKKSAVRWTKCWLKASTKEAGNPTIIDRRTIISSCLEQ